MDTPYIDRPNVVAKYKERKHQRNVLLFGRDVEADANSRSSGRSMFDGEMLVHGDVLVSRQYRACEVMGQAHSTRNPP